MRATRDHARRARRVFGAVAIVVATLLVTSAPGGASRTSKTPLDAYKRFAFEVEVGVSRDAGPSITVSTKGVYVRPHSQDCTATVSIGQGLSVSQHAVMIDDALWVGEGHGRLKPKSNRHAFKFEDQCASSPGFWKDFTFDHDPGIQGTTETRDGIAVEHLDLTDVIEAVRGLVGDMPSDVSAERASIWWSKHDHVVVGVDLALHAGSPDTCQTLLHIDVATSAPPTCTMTIRFDLSRFDDPKLEVRPGGPRGNVIRT